MRISKKIGVFVSILFMLTACQPTATATTQPSQTAAVITSPAVITTTATPPIPTVINVSTATTEPTATLADTATSLPATATAAPLPTAVATLANGTLPDVSSGIYFDDKSTAASLVLSYVNAINRHEYIRAYSYWNSPTAFIGSLTAFTNNYGNTNLEEVTFGVITSGGAAGSIYYTVPAEMVDKMNDGSTSKYASCFLIRLPEPGNFGVPPITPMEIDRGIKNPIKSSTSDSDALASACNNPDYPAGGGAITAAVESLADLSNNNYIDNRSGAVQVVSSLINALNRKEYVRAYSYWQNPATQPGNYNSYAAGFSDTGVVTAQFGTVTSDAGAGQYYYKVPLSMKVTTTSNQKQTFVGCYTLHLSNPGIQGTLPFIPLGIVNGKFNQVNNNGDVTSLLSTACN